MLAQDQSWSDHCLYAGHRPPGARWPVLPFYVYWLREADLLNVHVKDFYIDFFYNKEIKIGFFRFYPIKTF